MDMKRFSPISCSAQTCWAYGFPPQNNTSSRALVHYPYLLFCFIIDFITFFFKMLHLQSFPSSSNFLCPIPINFSLIMGNSTTKSGCGYGLEYGGNFWWRKKGRNYHLQLPISGVERDSEFEVDPDKAREALRKLDQQLQSLSDKKIPPPKVKASSLNTGRNQVTEPLPDFSGSFLAYLAFTLLVFTIFYNIIYVTVLEPSTYRSEQEPEPTPATISSIKASETTPLIELLPTPEVSVQP